jgi:glutamine cyclotransferase
MRRLFLVFYSFIALYGCNHTQNKSENNANQNSSTQNQASPFLLDFGPEGKISIGQKVDIKLKLKDSIQFDSLKVTVNETTINHFSKLPITISWDSKDGKLGQNMVKVIGYQKDKEITDQYSLRLVSDIVPKTFGYSILKTYPHDKNAYTQGLFFLNGFMYEATGLEGQSSLRKVKFENGDVIKSYQLPNNIFGEGITLYKDWIVQITWQSHVGFVYDKETFALVKKFEYPTEGWGIITLGDQLIMSDGSETLHFLETTNFTETKKIQVYDNDGPVDNINEMELINGEIYANIYRTDKLAKIDPETGKVTGYINLKNLLPETDKYEGIDVLNGIAFDKEGKRLFVTGKKWPKLFEIKIN